MEEWMGVIANRIEKLETAKASFAETNNSLAQNQMWARIDELKALQKQMKDALEKQK